MAKGKEKEVSHDVEIPTELKFELIEFDYPEQYEEMAEDAALKGNYQHFRFAALAAGLQRKHGDAGFSKIASRAKRSERWVRQMAQVGRVFDQLTIYPFIGVSSYVEIAKAKENKEIKDAQLWLDVADEHDLSLKQLGRLLEVADEGELANDAGFILDEEQLAVLLERKTQVELDAEVVTSGEGVDKFQKLNKTMLHEWYSWNHRFGVSVGELAEGESLELHHVRTIKSFKTEILLGRKVQLNNYSVINLPSSLHQVGVEGSAHEDEAAFITEQFGSREEMLAEMLRRAFLFINDGLAEAVASSEVKLERTDVEVEE